MGKKNVVLIDREKAAMICQNLGTECYKESQKRFTSKDRTQLRLVQDLADDLAKQIRALPPEPHTQ